MLTNFQIVIPGGAHRVRPLAGPTAGLREAEASPESSNHGVGLWIPGSSTLGLRPTASPRNDSTYDSNFKIAVLGPLAFDMRIYSAGWGPVGVRRNRGSGRYNPNGASSNLR
jgi:hypothetical protein